MLRIEHILPDKALLLSRVAPYRGHWRHSARPARIEPVGPGNESVWDYPRPPEIRDADGPVRVACGETGIAASERALRVCETAGAPVYYLPPDDVRMDLLVLKDDVSVCEWKGAAVYYDVALPDGTRVVNAGFAYPDPLDDLGQGFSRIAGWVGFYPGRLACFVGDERVRPQPGQFYAGWVTDRIKGPIKGVPGSEGW